MLKADLIYPHTPFIIQALVDYFLKYERNTKSISEAEKYLIETLRFHPYDAGILLKTINFYQETNNQYLVAHYSYMYGLRTQSKVAYQQALSNYLALENLKLARNVVNKLLRLDPHGAESLYFISKYFYKIKDYQKALSYLTNAYLIIKQPNSDPRMVFDVTLALAKLYAFLGAKDKASVLSQELLNSPINDKESLINVARLYKSLDLRDQLNITLKKIQAGKS